MPNEGTPKRNYQSQSNIELNHGFSKTPNLDDYFESKQISDTSELTNNLNLPTLPENAYSKEVEKEFYPL